MPLRYLWMTLLSVLSFSLFAPPSQASNVPDVAALYFRYLGVRSRLGMPPPTSFRFNLGGTPRGGVGLPLQRIGNNNVFGVEGEWYVEQTNTGSWEKPYRMLGTQPGDYVPNHDIIVTTETGTYIYPPVGPPSVVPDSGEPPPYPGPPPSTPAPPPVDGPTTEPPMTPVIVGVNYPGPPPPVGQPPAAAPAPSPSTPVPPTGAGTPEPIEPLGGDPSTSGDGAGGVLGNVLGPLGMVATLFHQFTNQHFRTGPDPRYYAPDGRLWY